MSKKDFKIARKPGQGSANQSPELPAPAQKLRARKLPPVGIAPATAASGPTTRKTIEVPEDYFFKVKMRALERKMLEKELWAEILGEYFKKHLSA